MTIELRTMRYVIAIAEAGGFERAAERLHISQPPLSRQIRELERDLGVTLFHRRPTQLTAQGHVFVRHARSILAAVDRGVAETRAAAGPVAGTVRVGCGPMSGTTDIPALVAAVGTRHPGIELDVVEMWDPDLHSALVAGDLDVVLGWELGEGRTERHVLRRDRYVVVVADDHDLADRKAVHLSDLRGELFRFLPRRFAPHYYDTVLAALRSAGQDFEVRERPVPGLRHFGDLREGGFNLLPSSITSALPAGLTVLDVLDDLAPAKLEMAWRAGAGRAVEAFAAVALMLSRE